MKNAGLKTGFRRCIGFSVILVFLFSFLFLGGSHAQQEKPFSTVAVITKEEFGGALSEPSALFFDESKKRLYVSDALNNRLVSYDEEFRFLSELSDKEFSLPMGVVKTPEGDFLTVDGKKAEMKLIDVKNKIVKPFAIKGLPGGREIFVPGRFTMDNSGRFYVIDRLNKRIVVIARDGTFLRAVSPDSIGDFHGFNDVRVDDAGWVYAVDTLGRTVYVFDDKGGVAARFGGGKTGLKFPVSIAVNKSGLIYVLDRHAGQILVFDRDGRIQYTISRRGMGRGGLYNPTYIFLDAGGRIYTIDGARVQVFEEGE